MYHLKAVISEISGEKTDNPTDNHLLKFRARKGRRHISSILTSPKPVLSMPTLHSATSTSKFIASSRSRPTAWWPGSYVVNVTQRNTDRLDAQTISLPWTSLLLLHAFSITKDDFILLLFLSAISIASFIQFFISEHTKISWWCQIQQNPVNRYGPPKKPITFQKHTRQL